MLRFLPRKLVNIRERHRFLLKIIGLSAGLHGLALIIFLIGMYFVKTDRRLVNSGKIYFFKDSRQEKEHLL